MKILWILVFFINSLCFKVAPPPELHDNNFQSIVGESVDELLKDGTSKGVEWFILFKINNCPHCLSVQQPFINLHYELQKQRFYNKQKEKIVLKRSCAIIDCEMNAHLCYKFNIEKYPTIILVQMNGNIQEYVGKRTMNEMLKNLQQINNPRSEGFIELGKITIWKIMLGYLDPLIKLMNHNVILFFVLFLIVPFLFGYLSSKSKKIKEYKKEIQQQEYEIVDSKENSSIQKQTKIKDK